MPEPLKITESDVGRIVYLKPLFDRYTTPQQVAATDTSAVIVIDSVDGELGCVPLRCKWTQESEAQAPEISVRTFSGPRYQWPVYATQADAWQAELEDWRCRANLHTGIVRRMEVALRECGVQGEVVGDG